MSEDGAGVDVASSSQWLHLVQVAVARMLKLRDNQSVPTVTVAIVAHALMRSQLNLVTDKIISKRRFNI